MSDWSSDLFSSDRAVEEDFHVLDGIDGDALLADVAHPARMVGVIAAVGGEVEGDREPLLAAGEVGAVEGVGFLGGGEAGILAQRPGPAGVHGRLGTTGDGREAGQASKALETLEALGGGVLLHRDV